MLVFAHRLAQLLKKSPALSCIFLTNCFMYGFGLVSGQVNVICEQICLLAEWTCVCKTNDNVLQWMLLDQKMEQFGTVTTFDSSDSAGEQALVGMENFSAVLINNSLNSFTSVINGTVDLAIDGFTLQCQTFGSSNSNIISIPGKPSQPENLTLSSNISTGHIILSWTPPINNSECVVGYMINSTINNSTVSIPNTLSHTLIPMGGIISSCTYVVSVAAIDTGNRTGDWNELLFSFEGSSPITSVSVIQEVYSSDMCNSTITIQWKIELTNCEPLVSSYFIRTINTNTNTYNLTSTNETTHILSDVKAGELYVIEIVPSSALGNGSATVTTISIPDYCTTTSNVFLPSLKPTTSGIPTPSGLSSVVIGVIVAIAVLVILLTMIGSVVTCYIYNKKKTTFHVNIGNNGMGHQDKAEMAGLSSDRLNSETESTENMMSSSIVPQTYMSPSDAKKEYSQHKPKTQEIPMYQEINHLKKEEHHGDRGHCSAQEKKRDTVSLDRDKITDMEGYSDLPAHSKKSANGKKSPSKNKSSTIKTSPGNLNYADVALSSGPHPPPPSQSSVDYASVYTPSEYATVQKNKKTHS